MDGGGPSLFGAVPIPPPQNPERITDSPFPARLRQRAESASPWPQSTAKQRIQVRIPRNR